MDIGRVVGGRYRPQGGRGRPHPQGARRPASGHTEGVGWPPQGARPLRPAARSLLLVARLPALNASRAF
ncbi:hypothetical protein R1flu_001491 [Riccia fluitans]|uniref:Uncharacterized protein n=1 Tax=Riccia fluitans TaxID=41844 RepID=A0ABD1Y3S3_9MARC